MRFGEHAGQEWTDTVTRAVALAFRDDPTWAPVVESTGDTEIPMKYWELFVRSAQRYPWIGSTPGAEAVTVWIPPGGEELTPEDEAQFPELALEWFGEEVADELASIIERFEAATPEGDYYYLSLLATHPDHRGHGHGMALLADNLRELDRLGASSYLESSNPANDARYERLGYRKHGTFELPSGLELATFWRDPHPVTRS